MRLAMLIITGLLLLAPLAQAGPAAPFALFPVVGGAHFTDDWGEPRPGGNRHEGTDLMAPCGTPTVAVVSGTVSLDYGARSGWMLTLRGSSTWYRYIHMNGTHGARSAFAKGLRDGSRVKAGQVVAYVGNTGDAAGGACHVHFELHRGNAVMSPFRWLQQATILQPNASDPATTPDASSGVTLTITGSLVWATTGADGRIVVRVAKVVASDGTAIDRTGLVALRAGAAALGDLQAGETVSVVMTAQAPTSERLDLKPLAWTAASATRSG